MNQRESANQPKVLRLETMPLDCGERVVVVELDCAPGKAWAKALKRVLASTDGLESVRPRCDGRFVYIIGVDPMLRGYAHRIHHALAVTSERSPAAETSCASAPTPSSSATWSAVSP
ncbi:MULTISPECIES: hypothetical protein [Stenotrophomonas]|uniref:hypothetical protein n=1 Tax=Stenotrophomonas TaxID=40323 RepID=UPI000D53EFAC|nr:MULTISPECIES: hypothetical protein [Stenotrophomonas]AWH29231.1 hypothetical protein C1931_10065 [Stenotrophomonas sp. YAU14A_MKIMI4_1]